MTQRNAVDSADVILSTRIATQVRDDNLIPSLDEYRSMFLIDENLMKYAKRTPLSCIQARYKEVLKLLQVL